MKKVILVLLLSIPAYAFALDVRYCTGDSVRVRSDHNTSASVLATMNKGTAFNIVSTSDRKETVQDKTDFWYKIVTENNVTGWVFGAFVSDSGKKSSATSSGVKVGEEYIFTSAWLFQEAKTDWDKPIPLKCRSKVKVLGKKGSIGSQFDHYGHWVKVQCGDVTGWVLDVFLTGSTDIDPQNATLYNICLFNDPQIVRIMQTECIECSDYDKKLKCYSALDMSKRKFNPLPEFNIGDTLMILKKNEVLNDRVKNLRLETNEANGACYLTFNTDKIKITYNEERGIGLYINKKRYQKDTPTILKNISTQVDPYALDAISFYLSDQYPNSVFGKTPVSIKKKLKTVYSVICTNLKTDDFRIYEFKPADKNNSWDSFTAIFNGNDLWYCNFSSVNTLFRISDRVYLSLNEWRPDCGYHGRKLLTFEDGMVKLILSQFYYSD